MSEIKHSPYSYKHHIIPKHEWKRRFGNLKGFNAPDNVVRLTIEQHADAHRWLWEEYGNENDKLAWQMMVGQIGKEELQRGLARITGKKNRGRKFTPEQNAAKSLLLRGNLRGLGYKHTEEWRKKHSETMRGNTHTLGITFKQKTSICPHCGINGGGGALKRYHFDNCKEKENVK